MTTYTKTTKKGNITTKEEIKVTLDGKTLMAITAFKTKLRAEEKLEQAEADYERWMSNVPDEDLDHFVAITDEMRGIHS